MHDKLPLELFNIENLLKLINENKFGQLLTVFQYQFR